MVTSKRDKRVLHIPKAGWFQLWLYDWFGVGDLWSYCRVKASVWTADDDSPLCAKCARQVGWHDNGDGTWTIPWTGAVVG